MKYFKYQYQDSLGGVWSLFSGLANVLEHGVTGRCDYSHTMEIINSAMNGNLVSTEENEFDLKSYELKCLSTDDIKLAESRQKFLTIVDNVGGDDGKDQIGYGEISSNKLKSLEDAFLEWENEDTFESKLADLCEIRKYYIVNKGIDIISMIKNSLNGIPEAVTELKILTSTDVELKDLVVILCENGGDRLHSRLKGLL